MPPDTPPDEGILEINDFSTATRFEKCVRAVELLLRQRDSSAGDGSLEVRVDSAAPFLLQCSFDRATPSPDTNGFQHNSLEDPGDEVVNDLWNADRDFSEEQPAVELLFGTSSFVVMQATSECDAELAAQGLSILTLAACNAGFRTPCFMKEVTPGGVDFTGYIESPECVVRFRTARKSPIPRSMHSVQGMVDLLQQALGMRPSLAGEGVTVAARHVFSKPSFSQKDWAYIDNYSNPTDLKWGAGSDPVESLQATLHWQAARMDNTYSQCFNDGEEEDSDSAPVHTLSLSTRNVACKLTESVRRVCALSASGAPPVGASAPTGGGSSRKGADVRAECDVLIAKARREIDVSENHDLVKHTFLHRAAYYFCQTFKTLDDIGTAFSHLLDTIEAAWEQGSPLPGIGHAILDGTVSLLDKKMQLLLFCIAASSEGPAAAGSTPCVAGLGEGFAFPLTQGLLSSAGAAALRIFSQDARSDAMAFKAANPEAGRAEFSAWRGDVADADAIWDSVDGSPVWSQLSPADTAAHARNALLWMRGLEAQEVVASLTQHFMVHAYTLLHSTNYVRQIPCIRAQLEGLGVDLLSAEGSHCFADHCRRLCRAELCASLAESIVERLMHPDTVTEDDVAVVLSVVDRLLQGCVESSRIALSYDEWVVVKKSLAADPATAQPIEPDTEEYVVRCAGVAPPTAGHRPSERTCCHRVHVMLHNGTVTLSMAASEPGCW